MKEPFILAIEEIDMIIRGGFWEQTFVNLGDWRLWNRSIAEDYPGIHITRPILFTGFAVPVFFEFYMKDWFEGEE